MKIKTFLSALVLIGFGSLWMIGLVAPINTGSAQGGPSPTPQVGTLIPPTLVPHPPATPTPPAVAMSGLAQIQADDTLTVGTLYNAPPFSWLDENGRVIGYEPEVLRAIGVDLNVAVEFVQVTRETAEQLLLSGEVDMLIGQRIHTREAEATMSFSHPYFTNFQKLVVREGSGFGDIPSLSNRPVSVVVGSSAETALNLWIAQNNLPLVPTRYLTQNEALNALANGEVEAMAGDFIELRRAGRQGMSFIDQPLGLEPYAIAFRRGDINLRNAINRSLQRLKDSGRMDEIAQNWFDSTERAQGTYFTAFIPVYANVASDTRSVDDFPPDMPPPNREVLEKIRNRQALNVAGLSFNDSAPAHQRFLDNLNQQLVLEMGRRWGVEIVFLPDTYNQGQDKIVQGVADLAVGVFPAWDGVDRVEYSLPYHYHSRKIIVLEGSRFSLFTDFRGGQFIGYFADEPSHGDRLQFLAETFNTNPGIYRFVTNEDVYEQIVTLRSVHGLYGDSIRLQAFMRQNNPDLWRFLQKNDGGDFSDGFDPVVLAVPRGDIEFLNLVNWTLGDMYSDGTFQRIWAEAYGGTESPPFVLDIPGIGDFLYQQLGQ